MSVYNQVLIKSFRHKALGQLFNGKPKGIRADLRDELKGDRKGAWSVTVNRNWRITFRFQDANALDVDFEDYH